MGVILIPSPAYCLFWEVINVIKDFSEQRASRQAVFVCFLGSWWINPFGKSNDFSHGEWDFGTTGSWIHSTYRLVSQCSERKTIHSLSIYRIASYHISGLQAGCYPALTPSGKLLTGTNVRICRLLVFHLLKFLSAQHVLQTSDDHHVPVW